MSWLKKSVSHVALIVAVGAGLFSVSGTPALAESWSIKSGKNIGALVPAETRKLPDGSTYVSGGSKQLVVTEDPTYPITGGIESINGVLYRSPVKSPGEEHAGATGRAAEI